MRLQLLALLFPGALACSGSSTKSDDTADMSECDMPVPVRFISVEEYETGLGPDGHQVMDHWSLTFEDTTFTWGFSDTVETGEYTCDGSELSGTVSWGPIEGTYDAPSLHLIWDGIDYERDPAG